MLTSGLQIHTWTHTYTPTHTPTQTRIHCTHTRTVKQPKSAIVQQGNTSVDKLSGNQAESEGHFGVNNKCMWMPNPSVCGTEGLEEACVRTITLWVALPTKAEAGDNWLSKPSQNLF